ncbi:hypothetical protein BDR26DRAFT_859930 [Obelidium mucronatum]|nr:hypothetical protein BDR26DRAFT_859930 [Obelidium mucronatum]
MLQRTISVLLSNTDCCGSCAGYFASCHSCMPLFRFQQFGIFFYSRTLKPTSHPSTQSTLISGVAVAAGSLHNFIAASASSRCVSVCLNKIPAVDINSASSVKSFCDNKELLKDCQTACSNSPLLNTLSSSCDALVLSTACQSQCLNQIPSIDVNSNDSITRFCSNNQLLSICRAACPNSTLLAAVLDQCNLIVPTAEPSPLATVRPVADPPFSQAKDHVAIHWTILLAILSAIALSFS